MSFVRDLLLKAADTIDQRASDRDVAQERSMAKTVKVFNALTGNDLTEAEGWRFMQVLKMVRGETGPYKADDHIDEAAYAALYAEAKQAASPAAVSGPSTPALLDPVATNIGAILDRQAMNGPVTPLRNPPPQITTAAEELANIQTLTTASTDTVTAIPVPVDLTKSKPDIGRSLETAVNNAVNKDAALWTGSDSKGTDATRKP